MLSRIGDNGQLDAADAEALVTILLDGARRMSATPAPVNKWLVAVSIAFGSLMATIDTSIVNVAMPQIRGELGASLQEITLDHDRAT